MLFASWQVSLTTNIIKAANSYVLLAVAAAVIGGTSLFGGRGKTIHGVLGGLVIGGIYNGLYLLGVSSQWIDVVVAGVLLAAAIIDVLSRRGAPAKASPHRPARWTPTRAVLPDGHGPPRPSGNWCWRWPGTTRGIAGYR